MKRTDKVRILSNGLFSGTNIMIGETELRVNDLDIRVNKNRNCLEVVLTADLPDLIIDALQSETTIKLVDTRKGGA